MFICDEKDGSYSYLLSKISIKVNTDSLSLFTKVYITNK